jgi:hypothetical protein
VRLIYTKPHESRGGVRLPGTEKELDEEAYRYVAT